MSTDRWNAAASVVVAACIALLLGACSGGGRGTATPAEGVAQPTATATSGAIQERPIDVPGSPAVLRFDGGVQPGLLSLIADVVAIARHEAGDSGPLVVHVYSTADIFVGAHEARSQEQARRDVDGGSYALAGPGTIWIYAPGYAAQPIPARRLALLHEYFHTVQAFLSKQRSGRAPLWMIEGSAKYVEERIGADRGYSDFNKRREEHILRSKMLGPLASYETDGGVPSRGGHGEAYTVGFLASDYLVQAKGADSLKRDFWVALASAPDWHQAFSTAFGSSTEDFYAAFESYRSTL